MKESIRDFDSTADGGMLINMSRFFDANFGFWFGGYFYPHGTFAF